MSATSPRTELTLIARAGPPTISAPVLRFFRSIVRGYFRRHFHAVRLRGAEHLRGAGPGPVIVFGTHGSWWDPMAMVLLADRLLPDRAHFAPMEEHSLERYNILKRIGVFGVELGTSRGGARFLRTGLSILERHGVLWITPQGRFTDPRERPIVFRPGLAALAARTAEPCTLVPLALEYPFWDERLPEALFLFGEPVRVDPGQRAEALEPVLEAALLDTANALAARVIARDPAGFDLLLRGRTGTGGFYQLFQSAWARLRGRPFEPAHTARPLTSTPVPQHAEQAPVRGGHCP